MEQQLLIVLPFSNSYNFESIEDHYLHSIYHYNTYVLGLICAWLVKNQVKPAILVSAINHLFSFN